jgi:hypothetical protein
MLLGWLTHECPQNVVAIKHALPSECPFSSLATLLKMFLAFQLQAGILPDDVQQSLMTVIKHLENIV